MASNTYGNHVFDAFDAIPLIALQALLQARLPQLRCHQSPVMHTYGLHEHEGSTISNVSFLSKDIKLWTQTGRWSQVRYRSQWGNMGPALICYRPVFDVLPRSREMRHSVRCCCSFSVVCLHQIVTYLLILLNKISTHNIDHNLLNKISTHNIDHNLMITHSKIVHLPHVGGNLTVDRTLHVLSMNLTNHPSRSLKRISLGFLTTWKCIGLICSCTRGTKCVYCFYVLFP
jgi:hypothetical protein